MKKVLFVATVDSHIELFHLPFLKMFKEKGWETSVATESDKPIKYCDKKIAMPIKRSPFKLISNFKAIRKLRKVIKEEKYDIIHCHTPMGGVVARMAARSARKNGTRVIYTAHGFHFYKGAPLHFWLMFYPVEWYLAKYTDTLITINNEDYERAKKKFGKRCKDIQYVPGVGVDPKKFEKKMSAKEKTALRKKLGLKNDDKVLICIGRLDKNKNQGFLIRAMDKLTKIDSSYHLLLVGPDEINGEYHRLVYKLGLEKNVHFLGFRKDIPELLQISDIAVSASKREGLPVNLIEAAMLGLPIVATDCRGNRDVCFAADGVLVRRKINSFNNELLTNQKDGKNVINLDYSLVFIIYKMNNIYCLDPPLVSVIIPVFNGEKTIDRCLDSVVAQSHSNLEIIVVDNCSTDCTRNIVLRHKKNDSRIKLLRCREKGVSHARNYGITHATGEYFCFIDSDDYVDKKYVQIILYATIKHDGIFAIYPCNKKFQLFQNDKIFCKNKYSIIINDLITSELLNSPTCKMYNNSIVKKNRILFDINTSIGEDLLFNYDYLKLVNGVFIGSDLLYFYDRKTNSNSLTNVFLDNKFSQLLYVNDKMRNNEQFLDISKANNYILMKNVYSVFHSFIVQKYSFKEFNLHFLSIKKNTGRIMVSKKYFLMSVLSVLYNHDLSFAIFSLFWTFEWRHLWR